MVATPMGGLLLVMPTHFISLISPPLLLLASMGHMDNSMLCIWLLLSLWLQLLLLLLLLVEAGW